MAICMMPDHQGIASLLSDLNLAVQELSAKVDRLAALIEAIEGQRGQFEPAPAPRHQSSPTRPAASLGQSSSSIFDSLATDISCQRRAEHPEPGEARYWARFCVQDRVYKCRPTKPIDLANKAYIVCSRPQILSVPCCVSWHLHIVPVSRARFACFKAEARK